MVRGDLQSPVQPLDCLIRRCQSLGQANPLCQKVLAFVLGFIHSEVTFLMSHLPSFFLSGVPKQPGF